MSRHKFIVEFRNLDSSHSDRLQQRKKAHRSNGPAVFIESTTGFKGNGKAGGQDRRARQAGKEGHKATSPLPLIKGSPQDQKVTGLAPIVCNDTAAHRQDHSNNS